MLRKGDDMSIWNDEPHLLYHETTRNDQKRVETSSNEQETSRNEYETRWFELG